MRNNLHSSGERSKKYTRLMTKNGKFIIWDHVYSVYTREKTRNLYTTDLRRSHIFLDSYSKMRVKLAVDTLSSKVATDDMATFENGETSLTQEYILNCEKFWNIYNDPRPIKSINDQKVQTLEDVLDFFEQ